MKLTKELLGLAGEYAVASELCKRGVYAQLTLGTHKQTDILVETEIRMMRIQVKAKQEGEWPGISGLYRPDDYLVLVDYKGKPITDRPDFYVLDRSDWQHLVAEEQKKRPDIAIDEQFRIRYPDGWSGLNVRPSQVATTREQWHKITSPFREGRVSSDTTAPAS